MQNILQDLTFALRQLRRSPGFALTAILTLALGIGANTAIFSLLDQALLRSLPVHDPASLVVLHDTGTIWTGNTSASGGDPGDYFSYPMYRDLRDQAKAFSGLVASKSGGVSFTRNNASEFLSGEVVSGNYFDVLGVNPALGRTLHQSDDAAPGANPVAVLTYDYWQSKLGADPSVVNSTVAINGHPYQIVGITARGFHSAVWGLNTQIFVPISMFVDTDPNWTSKRFTQHTSRWLNILGRLPPGSTPEQAAAATAPLWHALRADELSHLGTRSPKFVKGFLDNSHLQVNPGARGFSFNRTDLEKPFLAVMAMAALVLLIASVNVASLLLVRSAARVREFSLRVALGATSARVLSQLLIEGLLIGVCGGFFGILLAPAALHVLVSQLSDLDGDSPYSTSLDARVLLFNFTIAVLVALFFSIVPAWQLRKPALSSTLRESTGTQAGGLLQLRRIVVCLQIGLSVVLLVGAGLFIRTMQKLRAVDVGFNTAHLITFSIDPGRAGYKLDTIPALNDRITAALAALPGTQGVAASSDQELANNGNYDNVSVAGYVPPPDEDYSAKEVLDSPNFLATMGVPLLAGRMFTDSDDLTHPKVAIVNQTFADHYCAGSAQSCVGRQLGIGGGNAVKLDTQIIGVIRNVRDTGIRQEIPAVQYLPLRQNPTLRPIFFYLRTAGSPAQAELTVRSTMHSVDPSLALGDLHTMDQQIDADLRNERMITLLATAFGILATILAGVGLYGVLAYSTTQRTREIGIRMALGSTRMAVSSLIVSDVLKLAALGLILALPTAYGLSLLVRSQLFGVTALDPIILISVVSLIIVVALLAALLPARRAASINPTVALRTE